ncbi:hybrid sensor histidine kinase/response regulator [Anaerobranca gottschalkii]|uniref:Stage 0 sporulation protein A homolog n=1 Tax=Anaerobranca gottschalkii DSM 13577 TaxID=1120990 RepID=A0A1H9ZKF6_9FIRM|nr:ATP-binding protein [Anaerobranca gottschalkii]SES82206.1 PAS domain S-box-containing protein [Anaerobranca gottschalkii DSM 13577]
MEISESKIKRCWKNYYLFLIVVYILIFSLTINFIYRGLDSRERHIEYIVALDLYKLTWDEINLNVKNYIIQQDHKFLEVYNYIIDNDKDIELIKKLLDLGLTNDEEILVEELIYLGNQLKVLNNQAIEEVEEANSINKSPGLVPVQVNFPNMTIFTKEYLYILEQHREKMIQLKNSVETRMIEQTNKRLLYLKIFSYPIIAIASILPAFIAYHYQKTKKFNERLQIEKGLQSITLENIGDGVIAVDKAGLITIFNPAAQSITGYTSAEAIGKPINEIIKHKEKNKHFCNVFVEGIGCEEKDDTRRFWIVDKSGKEKYITKICRQINNESSPINIVFTIRDITEKVLMDREKELSQRLNSLGRLAGGIAHDFNNSLTILGGNIDLFTLYLKSENTTKLLPILNNLGGEVKRAKQLTSKLLTFARGGMPIKEPYNLEVMVKEGMDRALKDSKIIPVFQNDNKDLLINADSAQMIEVFENIIKNAKEAMNPETDTLWIEISQIEIEENKEYLTSGKYGLITIKNDGEEIPEDVLPNIFDPYFSTKGNEGLGLSTCYSIIKNHGGYIRVQSNENYTVFYIYLPIIEEKREEIVQSSTIEKENLSILVMDDEKSIREVCENLLIELGHRVETVENGEMAIEKYRIKWEENDPYDLLILDLYIVNGLGGKETLKEILKINPQAKAVVSSGYSDDGVMANYQEYGFIGVLRKPYDYQKLKDLIIKIPLT